MPPRFEASILAIVWAAPLFARLVMGATTIPLGLMAITALLAVSTSAGLACPTVPRRQSPLAPRRPSPGGRLV